MHGADSITKQSEWINTPIKNKMIVYTGDFENTVGAPFRSTESMWGFPILLLTSYLL